MSAEMLEMLAKRQDFLESLVESRLEGGEAPEELPGMEAADRSGGGPSDRPGEDGTR